MRLNVSSMSSTLGIDKSWARVIQGKPISPWLNYGKYMIEITLPWPVRELNPNVKVHWAQKSKAAKAYKEACFYLTKEAITNGFTLPDSEKLSLWLDFYPPDKRARDDDNCLSSFKSGRDGVADALGINDKRFVSHPRLMDTIGGMIKMRITDASK